MMAEMSSLTLDSQELSSFVKNKLNRVDIRLCLKHRKGLQQLLKQYQTVFLKVKAALSCEVLKKHCPNIDVHFMDPAIARELRQQPCYSVEYTYGNNTCQFTVFAKRSAAQLGLLHSAVNLLTIAKLVYSKPVHIQVNYFPSHMTKKLPHPGETLSSKHMNSGATLACGLGPIDCWREEEHDRTFCHELIHCLHVDFQNIPMSYLKPFYDDMAFNRTGCESGNCKTQILLNEAYTEVHTVLFHCMFVSQICRSDFFQNLKIELGWSLFQTAKVLHHNGFPDLMSLVNRASSKSAPWHQTTEVFGYIIVKSALLHQLGNFLNLYKTEKSARAKEFVTCVLTDLLNPALHHDVDQAMVKLLAQPEVSKIRQSLRFTALSCQS